MLFKHFFIVTSECGSQRGHIGRFDARFYGKERAGHLDALYQAWQSADAVADAHGFQRDDLNYAADAAYQLLQETEKQYTGESEVNILDTGILKYLSGDMIQGKQMMAFIADVRMEEVTQGKFKPVLFLKDKRLGIILNAGNTRVLASAYGMETDAWRGQPVIIYAEQGRWFGQDGWAVRLAIPAVAPSPTPVQALEQVDQMAEALAM